MRVLCRVFRDGRRAEGTQTTAQGEQQAPRRGEKALPRGRRRRATGRRAVHSGAVVDAGHARFAVTVSSAAVRARQQLLEFAAAPTRGVRAEKSTASRRHVAHGRPVHRTVSLSTVHRPVPIARTDRRTFRQVRVARTDRARRPFRQIRQQNDRRRCHGSHV